MDSRIRPMELRFGGRTRFAMARRAYLRVAAAMVSGALLLPTSQTLAQSPTPSLEQLERQLGNRRQTTPPAHPSSDYVGVSDPEVDESNQDQTCKWHYSFRRTLRLASPLRGKAFDAVVKARVTYRSQLRQTSTDCYGDYATLYTDSIVFTFYSNDDRHGTFHLVVTEARCIEGDCAWAPGKVGEDDNGTFELLDGGRQLFLMYRDGSRRVYARPD